MALVSKINHILNYGAIGSLCLFIGAMSMYQCQIAHAQRQQAKYEAQPNYKKRAELRIQLERLEQEDINGRKITADRHRTDRTSFATVQ